MYYGSGVHRVAVRRPPPSNRLLRTRRTDFLAVPAGQQAIDADLSLFYSVAASPSGGGRITGTAADSLGGFASLTAASGDLFPDIQAQANSTIRSEYRCVVLANMSSDFPLTDLTVTLSSESRLSWLTAAFDRTPASPLYSLTRQTTTTTGPTDTPPGAKDFRSADGSNPLTLEYLPARHVIGLWLQRTASGTGSGNDTHTVTIEAEKDGEPVSLTLTLNWTVAAPPVPPPTPSACPIVPDRCPNAFESVTIDHLVVGVTRVTWQLVSGFSGRTPFRYRLESGQTGLPNADDWVAVTQDVENVFALTDSSRRNFGKQLVTHYRVVLIDDNDVEYPSAAVPTLGQLRGREWTLAKELLRKEILRMKNWAGVSGFLLKRRRDGEVCPRCVHDGANMVTDSACPVCRGTRYVGGYFSPYPCTYSEVPAYDGREHIDDQNLWMSLPLAGKARFAGVPLLSSLDVFVDDGSDLRYYVHNVAWPAKIRNVPIIQEVELRQAPFDDPIYLIQVPRRAR